MTTVLDKQTKITSTTVFSNGTIGRDSNIKPIHLSLTKTLENLPRNMLISLLRVVSQKSIPITHKDQTPAPDIQEVERILLCSYSLVPLITFVWRLLEHGTTKSWTMTSMQFLNPDTQCLGQPKTSPNGSGEQLPTWVVVSQKMPTNQPLLFANIPQKVMLDQMTSPIHLDHTLITYDQSLMTFVTHFWMTIPSDSHQLTSQSPKKCAEDITSHTLRPVKQLELLSELKLLLGLK